MSAHQLPCPDSGDLKGVGVLVLCWCLALKIICLVTLILLPAPWIIGTGSTQLMARPAIITTLHLSILLAFQMHHDAAEATLPKGSVLPALFFKQRLFVTVCLVEFSCTDIAYSCDKQAKNVSTPLTSIMCLKGPSRPPHAAVSSSRLPPSQQRSSS